MQKNLNKNPEVKPAAPTWTMVVMLKGKIKASIYTFQNQKCKRMEESSFIGVYEICIMHMGEHKENV